jgi:hypothetical protein
VGRLALIGALAVALVLPAVGHGRIVPNKSIGSVVLGMSMAEAEVAAGTAEETIRTQDPYTGKAQTILVFRTFEARIEVGNTITRLITRGKRERIENGIGPGSTRAALKRVYPGAKCVGTARVALCTIGRPKLRGAAVTEFPVRKGKVTEVRVYTVL